MAIEVRESVPSDSEMMWQLVNELAIFERAPKEVTTTPDIFRKDMISKHFHAFVALEGDNIVGMALFYPIYSTWKGLSYYLEDIIVKESYRRQGIGSMLFEKVAEFCKTHNAGRLGWQVLDWNEAAIKFYERYGAEFDNEWITCRIRKEKLQELEF